MAPALCQQVLDAVHVAVDAVDELTAAALGRCTRALVESEGLSGAAVVRRAAGAVVPLASTGALPDDALDLAGQAVTTGTPVARGDLVAAPVVCPQDDGLAVVGRGSDGRTAELLVRAVARHLGVRLELVDTRRRLAAVEARTDTLMSATQALGHSLELHEVFSAILGQLRLVVPYDTASVQRLTGTRLQIIGGTGFPNLEEILTLGFDIHASDNPNRIVVETRRPLILADAPARYPAFRTTPHMPAGIRSWLGVPLEFGDELIGMLSIDARQPDFYDETHARIARAFAAQAAVAIENARLYEEMRRLATHDALTGLPNRRYLDDVGGDAVAEACREDRLLSLLVFDLDRFKVINDTHGHAVGDEVLRQVATRARTLLRPPDLLARFGGEEFVVLLPDTSARTAAVVAERLRRGIADEPMSTAAGDLPVTISAGSVSRTRDDEPLDELVRRADEALYEAKRLGRNRVVAADI